MSASRIYFDHNATAPLDQDVLKAMLPFLQSNHGNPASRHHEGRVAHDAVERARHQVAAAVNARPSEVFFTSSGTESNNTIIKGIAGRNGKTRIVTSGIEHPCVHCAARAMVRLGCEFIPVAVDEQGRLDFADLETAVAGASPAVVSIMLANNETGVVLDVARAAQIGHAVDAVVHSDCAQALGKIPVDFQKLNIDAMTISAHKAGGPMGIAALIVKAHVDCLPLLEGGGQENGMRSGTLNVAGAVGFGRAAELGRERLDEYQRHTGKLRAMLESRLLSAGAVIFSGEASRLPNTSYFGFAGIEGEALVVMIDQAGFAVASGSACASTKNEPSNVLMAMGCDEVTARTAVRVSLGLDNTEAQIEALATAICEITQSLRSMSAVMNA